MKDKKSYLKITVVDTSVSGKTNLYSVDSVSGILLGLIKWHGPWRKYTFIPAPDTIFDAGCLIEITENLNTLNLEHKNAKISE